MTDCVFCHRIAIRSFDRGYIHAVVFAPLGPHAPGHLLIVPRVHVVHAADDPSITAAVARVAALEARLADAPCNLITSIGAVATQSVFHLHFHLIPRGAHDRLPKRWPWVR